MWENYYFRKKLLVKEAGTFVELNPHKDEHLQNALLSKASQKKRKPLLGGEPNGPRIFYFPGFPEPAFRLAKGSEKHSYYLQEPAPDRPLSRQKFLYDTFFHFRPYL